MSEGWHSRGSSRLSVGRLALFGDLDDALGDAIFDWRLGWTPMAAHLPHLDDHPRCLVSTPGQTVAFVSSVCLYVSGLPPHCLTVNLGWTLDRGL